ncbi:hypothetical protein C8F04DRAFT_436121 [Mycena alexandri]|uniref:Uncharacterized protein n=1 Tax=Mycena alexandri TaxID=1745969 RepID=A0AAD6TKF8_9AGAR|nr:hypothetical protein C8F04DRAFT_436121 [Mycena alexandri]
MLDRELREDRHPAHAAEVRENLAPVVSNLHKRSDVGVPSLTLFPHEDVLACTLEYELEVAKIRQSLVDAGKNDPGRPPYVVGYGDVQVVHCRAHMPGDLDFRSSIFRFVSSSSMPVYPPSACPGIGTSNEPFPVIRTLLSIPFAVLHQLPRLQSMAPLTTYQHNVLRLATEITRLWSWDPVPASGPHGTVVPASASTTLSNPDPFKNLGSVASRTATLESIWKRIGEPITFRGRLGVPAPILVGLYSSESSIGSGEGRGDDDDSGNDEDEYASSSSDFSISSKEFFVGGAANDALMVRGDLHPGVYVEYAKIPSCVGEVDRVSGHRADCNDGLVLDIIK